MFERLVQNLVRRYLRDYVNLDDSSFDSLVVSLWQGDISIENVHLKLEPLQKLFGNATEVKHAVVDKIQVQIPWSSLQSQPVLIRLEGITVVACANVAAGVEATKSHGLEERRQRLLQLNASYISNTAYTDTTDAEVDPEEQKSFLEKLGEKILDNLQLVLKRVHVQYVDDATGVLGVTLSEVSLLSTDQNWNEAFIAGQDTLRKLAKIDHFCFYFNASTTKGYSSSSLLQQHSSRLHVLQEELIEFKVAVNRKQKTSKDCKYSIEVTFGDIDMALTHAQWLGLVQTMNHRSSNITLANALISSGPLRKPKRRIKEDPGAWWRWAILTVLQARESNRRQRERLRWMNSVRSEYVFLYKHTLKATAGRLHKLSEKQQERLAALEEDDRFAISDIVSMRALAHEEVKRSHPDIKYDVRTPRDAHEAEEAPSSWTSRLGISDWWYGRSSESKEMTQTEEPAEEEVFQFSEEERQELLKTIGYKENQVAEAGRLAAGFAFKVRFQASISGCGMTLRRDKQTLAQLSCRGIATQVAVSKEDFVTLHFSAASLKVADAVEGARFKEIVGHNPSEAGQQLFQASLSQMEESSDLSVRLNDPLEIVYSNDFFHRAVDFFTIPKSSARSIEVSASETLSVYKEMYEGRIEDYLRSSAQRKAFNVSIFLHAPIFALPGAEPTSRLAVQLGTLRLHTCEEQGRWECELANISITLHGEEVANDVLKDVTVSADLSMEQEEHHEVHCAISVSPLRADLDVPSFRRCLDILSYSLARDVAAVVAATTHTELTQAELMLLEVQHPLEAKESSTVISAQVGLPKVSICLKEADSVLIKAAAEEVQLELNSSEDHTVIQVKTQVVAASVGKSHLELRGDEQQKLYMKSSSHPDSGNPLPKGSTALTQRSLECPNLSGSIDLEDFLGVLQHEGLFQGSLGGSAGSSPLQRHEVAQSFRSRGVAVSDRRVNAIHRHFTRDKQRFLFAMDTIHSSSGAAAVPLTECTDQNKVEVFQQLTVQVNRVDAEVLSKKRHFHLTLDKMKLGVAEDYCPEGATRKRWDIDSLALTTQLAGQEAVHVLGHDGDRRLVTLESTAMKDGSQSVNLQLQDASVLLHPPLFSHTHELLTSIAAQSGSEEVVETETAVQGALSMDVSIDGLTLRAITGEALHFDLPQSFQVASNPLYLRLPQIAIQSAAGPVVSLEALEVSEGDKSLEVQVEAVRFKVDPALRKAIQSMAFTLPGGESTKALKFNVSSVEGRWVAVEPTKEVVITAGSVVGNSGENGMRVEVGQCRMEDDQQTYLVADEDVPFVVYTGADNTVACRPINFHLTPVSLPAILAAKADLVGLLGWVSGPPAEESEGGAEETGLVAKVEEVTLTFPSTSDVRLELQGFTYSSSAVTSAYHMQMATLRSASEGSSLALPIDLEVDAQHNTYFIRTSASSVDTRWTPRDLYTLTTALTAGLLEDGPSFEPQEEDFVAQDLFVHVEAIPSVSVVLSTVSEECGRLHSAGFSVAFKYLYSSERTELQLSASEVTYRTTLPSNEETTMLNLSDDPVFTYTQQWTGGDPVSYSATLPSIEVTWIAPAVQRMFVFAYDLFEVMEEAKLGTKGEQEVADVAQGQAWTWSFESSSMKVCFPSQSGSGLLVTAGIVTHVTVTVEDTFVRTVQMRLNHLTILTCKVREDLSVERAVNSILIPSNVAVTLVMVNTLSNLPLSRTVFVSLEDIDASWELQDTSTIMEVLVVTLRDRPTRKHLKYKLYEKALAEEEAQLAQAAEDHEGYEGVSYDIRGALTKLNFRVFSAQTRLPFVELRVAETSTFDGHGKGGLRIQEQRVKSTVSINGLSFSCFNAYINEWEPILEPCSLGVEGTSNLNSEVSSARASGTEVLIESASAVRFNVHPLHLLTLASCYYETQAMRDVAKDVMGSQSFARKTTRPLLFVNSTGLTLRIGLDASTSPSDVLVPNGQTKEIQVPLLELPVLRPIWCSIEGVAGRLELPLDNPGTHVVSAEEDKVQVLWKVDNSGGTQKGQLTALAEICNSTDRPIFFAFASMQCSQAFGHLCLDPDRSAFVPLTCMDGAKVLIRLSEEAEWREVEVAKIGEDVKRLLRLRVGESEQCLLLTMKQQSPLEFHTRISIEAPYKVWNLLTVPLYLSVRKGFAEQLKIPVGGFRYLYVYDALPATTTSPADPSQSSEQAVFSLAIDPSAEQQEQWLPLASKFRRAAYRMSHRSGRTVVHRIDNARRPREIMVYARFWIVNHTSVPLTYGNHPPILPHPRAAHISTCENQRRYAGPTDGTVTDWTDSLLSTDRPAWSDAEGVEERRKESFTEDDGSWEWAGDWEVEEEWEYASSFGSTKWVKEPRESDRVRRRRWVRRRQRDGSGMFFAQEIHTQDDPRLCFKMDEVTGWSEAVDLSAAGTIKTCRLVRKQRGPTSYEEVVCSIEAPLHQADGLLQRTNICKIYHRTLLVNDIAEPPIPLRFKHHDDAGGMPQHLVAAKEEQAFASVRWGEGTTSQLVVMQLGPDEESAWSCPLSLHRLGNHPMSVLSGGKVELFRVEVNRGGCDGTFVARIRREDPRLPLIKVENLSSDVVQVQQVGFPPDKQANALKTTLQPNESAPFAWCCPAVETPKMQLLFCDGSDLVVDVFDLGASKPMQLEPFDSAKSLPQRDEVVRYASHVVLRTGTSEDSQPLFWSAVRPPMHASSVLSRMDSRSDMAAPWLAACVLAQPTPIKLLSLDDIEEARAVRYGDILKLQAVVGDGSERLLTATEVPENEHVKLEWAHPKTFSTDKRTEELSHFIVCGGDEGSPLGIRSPNVWLLSLVNPDLVVTISEKGMLSLEPLKSSEEGYAFTMENLTSVRLPRRKVFVRADIDGSMRVVRISSNDTTDALDVDGEGVSKDTRLVDYAEELSLSVKIDLSDCSVSLIDEKPEELCVIWLNGELSYKDTNFHTSIEAKLKGYRVDNQLTEATFVNVLRPDVFAKVVPNNALHLSIVIRHHMSNFFFLHYLGLNAADIDCHVDATFLKRLTSMQEYIWENLSNVEARHKTEASQTQTISPSTKFERFVEKLRYVDAMVLAVTDSSMQSDTEGSLYYVEMLQIYTLRINLSYKATSEASGVEDIDPIMHVMSALQVGIQNIDSAPVVLRALALEHPCATFPELKDAVKAHYASEVNRNMFTILGRINAFGNPGAALSTLGGAVHVFLNEPMQGLVKSPEEFGRGLSKGTAELVKGTIRSLAMVTGGMAGSVSKTVSYIASDSQEGSRRTDQRKPRNVADGFVAGGEGLLRGFQEGITGIVSAPAKGAKKEGVGGFFKGLGTGVVGAVAKPVGGLFDMVSKTTEGAVAQTKSNEQLALDHDIQNRKFAPRLFQGEKKQLTEFNDMETRCVRAALDAVGTDDSSAEDYFGHISFSGLPFVLLFTATSASLVVVRKSPTNQPRPVEGSKVRFASSMSFPPVLNAKVLWRIPFDSARSSDHLRLLVAEKPCTLEFVQEELVNLVKGMATVSSSS